MTRDEEIIAAMRSAAAEGKSPVQVAEVLDAMTEEGLDAASFIFLFGRAFPQIPLPVLIRLQAWSRLSACSMTDDEINAALAPWFPGEPNR